MPAALPVSTGDPAARAHYVNLFATGGLYLSMESPDSFILSQTISCNEDAPFSLLYGVGSRGEDEEFMPALMGTVEEYVADAPGWLSDTSTVACSGRGQLDKG